MDWFWRPLERAALHAQPRLFSPFPAVCLCELRLDFLVNVLQIEHLW